MPWVRLEDGFAEHPKIIGLSDAAFRAYVAALCYCNRNLTDGHVPAVLGNGCLDELVTAGLWSQNGGASYEIHDFGDYQPTGEQTERIRLLRREAGRKGGIASGQARREANEAKSKQVAKQTRSKTEAKSNPVPVPVPQENKDIRTVYDCWRVERGRKDTRYEKMSDNRKAKITARLREFSVDELCTAIRAVRNDPWDGRVDNDDLTILFRSQEQVEKFLGLATSGTRCQWGNDRAKVQAHMLSECGCEKCLAELASRA